MSVCDVLQWIDVMYRKFGIALPCPLTLNSNKYVLLQTFTITYAVFLPLCKYIHELDELHKVSC